MSLNLIRAIAMTENADEFHLGRILLLLLAADSRNTKTIEGITKLAKLDFLLRYPTCLERALIAEKKKAELVQTQAYERTTIESKMIRFKYGPWDGRYRRWIGLLAGRGLVNAERKGHTVHVGLTDRGREISQKFANEPAYKELQARSQLVIKIFGNVPATRLKDFVYRVFPELENMKWGEVIIL